MGIFHDDLGRSGRTLSDVGAFVERAAHAANPSRPKLGRVAAVVAVARLGMQLLPASWRLMRRYPVVSAFAIGGLLLTAYARRPERLSSRS